MSFRIEKKLKGKLGRAGILETPHGAIHTPAFVAVGTKATVKALTPAQLKDTGAEVVLGNTYHLYLEPGEKVVERAGGLAKFMGWDGPTMTDSGGFQVFSLGAGFGKNRSKITSHFNSSTSDVGDEAQTENLETQKRHTDKPENVGMSLREPPAKVDEDGVTFRSPKDGSEHRFTAERSIEIQHALGADIIFAFDECTSPCANKEYQRQAMERTHRWAARSLGKHRELKVESEKLKAEDRKTAQMLFGIVQGGRFEDLRKESAQVIGGMLARRPARSRNAGGSLGEGGGFDGFGIGGSFEKEDIDTVVGMLNRILPEEKPRHLLGIGEPLDLFGAVENGCDLFDCVTPTRQARNGTLYTKHGKINIENAACRSDCSPIEQDCECYACLPRRKGGAGFTKAYLAHLFRSGEILANTLATIHNLHFIVQLVKKMREAILNEIFEELRKDFVGMYKH